MLEIQSGLIKHTSSWKQPFTSWADCSSETAHFVVTYLHYLQATEQLIAESLESIAQRHVSTVDAHDLCLYLARYSRHNAVSLQPFLHYYSQMIVEPLPDEGVRSVLLDGGHLKELNLLMDLQDAALLLSQAKLSWIIVRQTAMTLKDRDLLQATTIGLRQTKRQLRWLENYLKLVVLPNAMLPSEALLEHRPELTTKA